MFNSKTSAPFLSDAWRRLTYYARGMVFPNGAGDNREAAQGQGEQGKKGRSTGGLGLGNFSLELNAPSPQPPFEMTSPHFITLKPFDNRLVPKAFWKLTEAEKKIEKELKAAGISFAEYMSLKKDRLGFTVQDMHIHARSRRNKQSPFWVRTPQGGLARISADKINYLAPGSRFTPRQQYQEELKFLAPYIAHFQHVQTNGSTFLQTQFSHVLQNYNVKNQLNITHQPTHKPGENAELVNRLNVEAAAAPNKWFAIALRHGATPSLKPTYKNPALQPQPEMELTPAPELRLIPPFNPRPRPR